jgi:hypothetical protein
LYKRLRLRRRQWLFRISTPGDDALAKFAGVDPAPPPARVARVAAASHAISPHRRPDSGGPGPTTACRLGVPPVQTSGSHGASRGEGRGGGDRPRQGPGEDGRVREPWLRPRGWETSPANRESSQGRQRGLRVRTEAWHARSLSSPERWGCVAGQLGAAGSTWHPPARRPGRQGRRARTRRCARRVDHEKWIRWGPGTRVG